MSHDAFTQPFYLIEPSTSQSVEDWAERWRILWQKLRGILVKEGGARTPLGTLKQGTEPTIAHVGPCDKLMTRSGVYPAFIYLQLG